MTTAITLKGGEANGKALFVPVDQAGVRGVEVQGWPERSGASPERSGRESEGVAFWGDGRAFFGGSAGRFRAWLNGKPERKPLTLLAHPIISMSRHTQMVESSCGVFSPCSEACKEASPRVVLDGSSRGMFTVPSTGWGFLFHFFSSAGCTRNSD